MCIPFCCLATLGQLDLLDKLLANSLRSFAPLCNKPISNQNELTRCPLTPSISPSLSMCVCVSPSLVLVNFSRPAQSSHVISDVEQCELLTCPRRIMAEVLPPLPPLSPPTLPPFVLLFPCSLPRPKVNSNRKAS